MAGSRVDTSSSHLGLVGAARGTGPPLREPRRASAHEPHERLQLDRNARDGNGAHRGQRNDRRQRCHRRVSRIRRIGLDDRPRARRTHDARFRVSGHRSAGHRASLRPRGLARARPVRVLRRGLPLPRAQRHTFAYQVPERRASRGNTGTAPAGPISRAAPDSPTRPTT